MAITCTFSARGSYSSHAVVIAVVNEVVLPAIISRLYPCVALSLGGHWQVLRSFKHLSIFKRTRRKLLVELLHAWKIPTRMQILPSSNTNHTLGKIIPGILNYTCNSRYWLKTHLRRNMNKLGSRKTTLKGEVDNSFKVISSLWILLLII